MLHYWLELLESGVSALCLADAHMWLFLSMWLLLRPWSEKTMDGPLSWVIQSQGERFQLLAAIAPHPRLRSLVLGLICSSWAAFSPDSSSSTAFHDICGKSGLPKRQHLVLFQFS